MKLREIVSKILAQKLSPAFYFSAAFFVLSMSVDYTITSILSYGDHTLEGNAIARWWWEIAGVYRFIEIPFYVAVILITAYVVNFKNKLFPLFWLNLLAFNHLIGAYTWLPYGTIAFLDSVVRQEWVMSHTLSTISVFLTAPLTFLQYLLVQHAKR